MFKLSLLNTLKIIFYTNLIHKKKTILQTSLFYYCEQSKPYQPPIIKRIYSLSVGFLLVACKHFLTRIYKNKIYNNSIMEWSCTTSLLYISMQTRPSFVSHLVLECLQEVAESYLQPRMTCRNAYVRCQLIMFLSFGKLFLATFVFLLLL